MRLLYTILLFLLAAAGVVMPLQAQTQAQSHAPARLERITEAQLLRVCIWPDYYGITYRDPKTQRLSGIDIDLAQELAKDLAVKVEFVDSSFARLVDDVSTGRCDIAMFGIGITPSRMEKLRFSRAYLASDIYAIATKTNRRIKSWGGIDKVGSVVAVSKGTLHEPVMKERLKNAQLLVLDTPFAREQEVQSGRADVFMTDYPYSQRFLISHDWARLLSPPGVYQMTPYAYAIQQGDDGWHARVELFVAAIKRDGRLMAAAQRHKLEAILAF
jgi:cyclohexadienyl dehydratase